MISLYIDQQNVHAAAVIAHPDDAKTRKIESVLTGVMQPLVHRAQQWPVCLMHYH
jgi:hypothetical protein